jgi:hypothetical protein
MVGLGDAARLGLEFARTCGKIEGARRPPTQGNTLATGGRLAGFQKRVVLRVFRSRFIRTTGRRKGVLSRTGSTIGVHCTKVWVGSAVSLLSGSLSRRQEMCEGRRGGSEGPGE